MTTTVRRTTAVLGATVVLAVGLLPTRGHTPAVLVDGLGLTGLPDWAEALATAVAVGIGLWFLPRTVPLAAFALPVAILDTLAAGLAVGIASYAVARWYRRPLGLLGYAVLAVLVLTGPVALAAAVDAPGVGGDQLLSALGGTVLFLWLPATAGLWTRLRRQQLTDLRDRAERLERERTAAAVAARAEERTRIAHDMHDVVAHRVSLMVMHAGALEVNATAPDTIAAAELIRTTGVQALSQLRDVLGVLRTDPSAADVDVTGRPQPTLADLTALLAESRRAGLSLTLDVDGDPDSAPVIVQQAAFRIVREALTNVHKHAGPVPVHVSLRRRPDRLELSIRNTAPAAAPAPLPGGGTGLAALRDRVGLLGGSLTAEPAPDGAFAVIAVLPTPEPGEPA